MDYELVYSILGDKHFRGMSFDDDFLLQYLRCRKFNAKRAFTQLKAFVNLRKNYKFMFKDLHFENIAISTKNKIVSFLPYRCQDGCAIILVKLGLCDFEYFLSAFLSSRLITYFYLFIYFLEGVKY